MRIYHSIMLFLVLLFAACADQAADQPANQLSAPEPASVSSADTLRYEKEGHFRNMHQLTFGGDNAEAYWSFDNEKLVFQAANRAWGAQCDQIFWMNLDAELEEKGKGLKQISNGQGRTTCAYFLPGDTSVVFASTHLIDSLCPEVPPKGPNGEYVWPIYDAYDIFTYNLDGEMMRQITSGPGYDAEATVSPKGDRKYIIPSPRYAYS